MKLIEQFLESFLWNSRFVVLVAVLASLAAGFALFYIATVDVFLLVQHLSHYADASLSNEARRLLHDDSITHIVEVLDSYLLGIIMLIFSLGLYELFISDIDPARFSKTSSKVLLINNMDDLKNRLAKVIVMMLIVTLFEHALETTMGTTADLLNFGGSIALIGLALFLMHKAESHPTEKQRI